MIKRQARAGERIRITNPFMAKRRYKKGDELICKSAITTDYIRCENIDGVLENSEYVVLEKGIDYD